MTKETSLKEAILEAIERWIKDYEAGEESDEDLRERAWQILLEIKDSIEIGEI